MEIRKIVRYIVSTIALLITNSANAEITISNYQFSQAYLGKTIYYKYLGDDGGYVNSWEAAVALEACRKTNGGGADNTGYSGDVTIPSEVTYNGKTIPVIGIGEYFCIENKSITSVTIPSSITYIKYYAFEDSWLATFSIPKDSNLKSVGQGAFDGCRSLTSIDLPVSLETIGEYAFSDTKITTIKFPEGVTNVPKYACYGCPLTSVVLPNSVVEVGVDAFSPGVTILHEGKDDETTVSNPKTIKSFTMPSGVRFYNDWIGYCLTSDAKIYCTSNNPLPQSSDFVSDDIYENGTLYVQPNVKSLLVGIEGWNKFKKTASYYLTFNDVITCNGLTVKPDGDAVLKVSTTLKDSYKGFQFDLVLPDNMEFVSAKLNDALTSKGWGDIYTYKYTDKIIRIQALPKGTGDFTASITDDLIVLNLKAGEFATENSEINVSNFTFIKASDSSVIYTTNKKSQVTVVDIPIFSVNWIEDFGQPTLREGESIQLSADYSPAATATPTYTWTSSDPSIASVSSTGLVTAIKAGVTKISVSAKNALNEKSNSLYVVVTEPIWGDANDNGVVNVADIVTIGNRIAERTVDNFFMINADVNKDNAIDVSDLNATVNIVMGASYAPKRMSTYSTCESDDYLYANQVYSETDGNTKVNVGLSSSYPYSAIQADVLIPEGMTVNDVSLSGKARNHELIYNLVDDNLLKVVIYSITNESFVDSECELFSIHLDTNGNSGNLYFDNIIASDNSCNRAPLAFIGDCNLEASGVEDLESSIIMIKGRSGCIEILNALNCRVSVYDMDGHFINSLVASSNNEAIKVSAGIYIVKTDKGNFKINVK